MDLVIVFFKPISFIGLWEVLHNPGFNCLEFEAIKNEAGDNSFVMTPKRWIETTKIIKLVITTTVKILLLPQVTSVPSAPISNRLR